MKSLYNITDWNDIQEHQMLGEILLEAGKINLIHLGMALDIQRFQKMPLGEIFVSMKILSVDDLTAALNLQTQIDKMITERG